ncbi:MAG: hypothetical protein PHO26_08075 [Dehalococcoidia bacterium]|nr:hypothetical protein [Dehalococcoidia bacterium]MDD5494132.1 hypothetical protein [Dehalococcoidia bacterium]
MFGKGKISITVAKTRFTPGDTISGGITLTLKKPVKANEASISLICEQTVTRPGNIVNGKRMSSTTDHNRVYDFKQKLDGEKEYGQQQSYQFELTVPADALNMSPQIPGMGSGAGELLNVLQTASAIFNVGSVQSTKWYLQAKLDIPGGFDVTEKTDISIA